MSVIRWSSAAAAAVLLSLLVASSAPAQVTMVEPGFLATTLSGDFAKQVELGVGPDTCLYYGSSEGLKKRCAPADMGVVCDPSLTFPTGIAFSTGGSFGNFMYVSDFGIGGIRRSSGCVPTSLFANILGPGSIAFPPAGSAYGDYLYACVAYEGPISRISSTGIVTSWLPLETLYLRFGPGGTWGSELFAIDLAAGPPNNKIVKISSAGAITTTAQGFINPEGFDWGFDGDLFATDVTEGTIYRVKPNGAKTLFATLPGAADVAYRPGEQALYAVSLYGGLHRIVRGSGVGVPEGAPAAASLAVAPNPASDACAVRFTMLAGGRVRAQVWSAAGRIVRRLGDAWRPAGAQSIAWDGRDESGARVPPGAYFARVELGGQVLRARVTIVR
jgi:hypothetical protein